jgi:hypothetical protein
MFNATFNNISIISVQSVLFVEEMGVSEENHRSAGEVTDTPYHKMLHCARLAMVGFELTTLKVIGTNYMDICKYNYRTIMIDNTPFYFSNALNRIFLIFLYHNKS